MAQSALANIFREFILEYEVESNVPTSTDDVTGAVRYGSVKKSLKATLEPSLSSQLRSSIGADPKDVVVKGSLMSPTTFPKDLGIGSEFSVVWANQKGILTVKGIDLYALETVEELLGQDFVGVIRLVENV